MKFFEVEYQSAVMKDPKTAIVKADRMSQAIMAVVDNKDLCPDYTPEVRRVEEVNKYDYLIDADTVNRHHINHANF